MHEWIFADRIFASSGPGLSIIIYCTSMSRTERPCQQTQSPLFTAKHMATVRRPVGKPCVCRLTMSAGWAKTWVIWCFLAKSRHVITAHNTKQVPTRKNMVYVWKVTAYCVDTFLIKRRQVKLRCVGAFWNSRLLLYIRRSLFTVMKLFASNPPDSQITSHLTTLDE